MSNEPPAVELGFRIVIVTRDWVKIPAEAYADRLMESVDMLYTETKAGTAT